jgi:hypothetical protein
MRLRIVAYPPGGSTYEYPSYGGSPHKILLRPGASFAAS